jgi:hypothetical protein
VDLNSSRELKMALTKLTLTIDEEVVRRAREYSDARQTSISRLVNSFLAGLTVQEPRDLHPVIQRLAGLLPSDTDEADYYRHLEETYL